MLLDIEYEEISNPAASDIVPGDGLVGLGEVAEATNLMTDWFSLGSTKWDGHLDYGSTGRISKGVLVRGRRNGSGGRRWEAYHTRETEIGPVSHSKD